jgi:hypothetical protein
MTGMSRRSRLPGRWWRLPLAVCGLLWLGGCPGRSTPQRACEQLHRAVAEGDPGAVFDWLYEPTQWAFYTVQKNHRKMRDLIRLSYPATEREAALGRLYGSEADSGRELFAQLYPQRYGQDFAARLGSGPSLLRPHPQRPGDYLCGAGDRALWLRRADSGLWGVADLASDWEQAQLRAVLDLATVEKNAALYRRVAAPAAQ